MTYFQDAEFYCKCGNCPLRPLEAPLLARLNGLRGTYGKPLYVSSGWRCEPYNRSVGGAPDSSHLTGQAADLFCTSSGDRFRLLNEALKYFNRIGIGSTFLHVDVDKSKTQEVIWLYGTH